MRLLADSCVAGGTVRALRHAGHDVEWVAEWGRDPGDRAILRYAHEHDRVLLTDDKDFGDLAFRDAQPHSGIVLIANGLTLAEEQQRVVHALAQHAEDLKAGYIVVIALDRTRLSRKPSQSA